MEGPQTRVATAEWIAGSLVDTTVIDDRELRFSARWNAASVAVELLRSADRTVWLATVTLLGRRQHGYPLEPRVRSNYCFADWIGVDDFDRTAVRETVRKTGEGLWIAVDPTFRSGYYQH
ncbi:hypothetical protein [Glycomyces salinus]|uniref:hypothetical protein n=1 Tax=Glycomyces salinus TaxID=980294 RepID=UPI0018EC2983|nr:hypothetical protein [Glycomyces salinus]